MSSRCRITPPPGARVDGELRRDFIIGADRGAQFHRHAGDAVDRRL
jgi:hypothetical protein